MYVCSVPLVFCVCFSDDEDERSIVTMVDNETIASVRYPFLPSHPQFDLAKRQMSGGGTVVTFDIKGGKDEAFKVLDALQIVDISNNLGDSKSLVTHPATTTHRRLGRPASHGCVRLHPRNAATLYRLVKRSGARNTRIRITH